MRRTGLVLATIATGLSALGFAAVLALAGPADARCSGCGCKGGPGYRGPDGRCVGWADLAKVCGTPPTKRCKAELVNTPPERPRARPKRTN